MFFVKIHSLVSCFGISGFMSMTFRKLSSFMGILLRFFSGYMNVLFENSPDLWVVLLRSEWHNPVSWKLK